MHPVGVILDGVRDVRTGPNEAHVAEQDVPELRELIQAGAAQECADAGDPRVVRDLVQVAFRPVLQQRPDERGVRGRVAVRAHRPELHHREAVSKSSDPLAAIDDRTLSLEPDRDRHGEENR